MNTELETPAAAIAAVGKLQLPDTAKLEKSARLHANMAATLTISSDDEYELAAEDLRAISEKWKTIEAQRVSITGPINTSLRLLNALFAGPLKALDDAKSTYKAVMLGYTAQKEQEAKRIREENERAAQVVRDIEAQIQKKIADDAALAEQQARDCAAALMAEGKAEEAAAVMAQNDMFAAQAVADIAASQMTAEVTIAAPAPAAVKAAGISSVKAVDFELKSLIELVEWVAATHTEHPHRLAYLRADEIKIRSQVKATGLQTSIAGVRVFEKARMTVR